MPDAGPRCADWARAVDVDPAGTATAVTGWLLVDWPLPWPRDAADVEGLAPVHAALAGTGIRLQLVVPRGDAPHRGVVLHRRPDDEGWFAGFERAAVEVPPDQVVAAALDLLAGGAGDRELAGVADVLVCGHGSRDRCCGSRGTALALDAVARGVAVRRTSHTGGHRFAPTGVLLPEGTMWAFLDADAIDRLVVRQGPLDDLLPRYRGCSGVGPAPVQALERAAFAEVGWSWLDHRRRGVEAAPGLVRLDAVSPDGRSLAWEADVEAGRLLPVPECGRAPEDAPKHEAEVVVRSAWRVDPAGVVGDRPPQPDR